VRTLRERRDQVPQFARPLLGDHLADADHGDSGRVVPPVLKAVTALDHHVKCLAVTCVPHDSAHESQANACRRSPRRLTRLDELHDL